MPLRYPAPWKLVYAEKAPIYRVVAANGRFIIAFIEGEEQEALSLVSAMNSMEFRGNKVVKGV